MKEQEEWVQLAHFDAQPGHSSHKDMDVFWLNPDGAWGTNQQVTIATGCCGCETTLTGAQFEQLVEAWLNRGRQ